MYQITSSLPNVKMSLLKLDAVMEISQLYSIEIIVIVDQFIAVDQWLQQDVAITLQLHSNESRYFWGRVCDTHQISKRANTYQLKLVPPHWWLTHSKKRRIFSQSTMPDMVNTLLLENYISNANLLNLSRRYEIHEYCTQYDEADWPFIERILAKEGVFYYFKFSAKAVELVISDGKSDQHYSSPIGQRSDHYRGPSLWGLRTIHRTMPGEVGLIDHPIERPNEAIFLRRAIKAKGVLQNLITKHYPGDFQSAQQGALQANIAAQRMLADSELFIMNTNCSLQAGMTFSSPDLQKKCLVRRVEHHWCYDSGQQERYYNRIIAMPAERLYHPALRQKPLAACPESAEVIGAVRGGFHPNARAQVLVRFAWGGERWVSVAHVWAGAQCGAFFMPRVGATVIVHYHNADPNVPIIFGQQVTDERPLLYTPLNQPYLSAIRSQNWLVDGVNDITFDDAPGAAKLTFNAGGDFESMASKNITITAGDDIGLYSKKAMTFSTPKGSHAINAGQSIILSAGNSKIVLRNNQISLQAEKISFNG